jgi:hypothetical protein
MTTTILIVALLIIVLIAVLPRWNYMRSWDVGYAPSVGTLLIIVVVLILFFVGRPVFGQTKTEEVKTFVIDFTPLFNTVIWPALSVLAMAVVGVLVNRIQKKWGVEIDKKTIESAMTNGLQLAQSKFSQADLTQLRVQSEIVAGAANYAISHVPSALKNLGVDVTTQEGRESLKEKLEARLAPAVMVAEASPGPVSVAVAATIANPNVSTAPAPVVDALPKTQ